MAASFSSSSSSYSQQVVLRKACSKETETHLIQASLQQLESLPRKPKEAVVAHLGSRFGPVIAFIDVEGAFHAHPSLPEAQRIAVRDGMLSEDGATFLVVPDLPHPKSVSYRRKAVLNLELTYRPDLAQEDVERSPQLHLYLSDDVARGVYIVRHLSSDEPTKQTVLLQVNLTQPTIPVNCLLNVQAYAMYLNSQRQWCMNQCGYANVALAVAVDGRPRKEALRVNNASNPDGDQKGEVEIRVVSVRYLDDGSDVPVERTADARQVMKQLEQDEVLVRDYIHQNRSRCYERLPASSEAIERITVYTFQTQSHGYVPGSYFDVFRIPRSRAEYTLNALEIGRARSHLVDRDPVTRASIPLSEFFSDATPLSKRAKVVMWAVALYVTSCLYITDEVDHNHRKGGRRWSKKGVELIESFDNMITRDAGDCEDFTRAMLVFIHSIKNDYGVAAASRSSGGPLVGMAEVLNHFVCFSALCGVSRMALAELKQEERQGDRVELDGHECVIALDRETVRRILEEDDPVRAYMDREKQQYPRYYSLPTTAYVLEGTGVLNPEPFTKPKDVAKLEQEIQEMAKDNGLSSVEDARTLFVYNPGTGNNFYKMFVTLMTPEFMTLRGIPKVEFVLYKQNALRGSYRGGRHAGKRGVWFDELLNLDHNPDIRLAGCPAFDARMERACTTLTKDNVPIWRPYQSLTEVPPEWLEYEKAMGGPSLELPPKEATCATFFLPAALVTPKHVQQLQAIARATRCHMTATLEPVRQNPNGHRVGNFLVSFVREN